MLIDERGLNGVTPMKGHVPIGNGAKCNMGVTQCCTCSFLLARPRNSRRSIVTWETSEWQHKSTDCLTTSSIRFASILVLVLSLSQRVASGAPTRIDAPCLVHDTPRQRASRIASGAILRRIKSPVFCSPESLDKPLSKQEELHGDNGSVIIFFQSVVRVQVRFF